MKYFEYMYLMVSILLAGILVQQYSKQAMWQNYLLIAGIIIASFMFSFRRTQRLRNKDKNQS